MTASLNNDKRSSLVSMLHRVSCSRSLNNGKRSSLVSMLHRVSCSRNTFFRSRLRSLQIKLMSKPTAMLLILLYFLVGSSGATTSPSPSPTISWPPTSNTSLPTPGPQMNEVATGIPTQSPNETTSNTSVPTPGPQMNEVATGIPTPTPIASAKPASRSPTNKPTSGVTAVPTSTPTANATSNPSPSINAAGFPTVAPFGNSTSKPSAKGSVLPESVSSSPTKQPQKPTSTPTKKPITPTNKPHKPTAAPTKSPVLPTKKPHKPTASPTTSPILPTKKPHKPTTTTTYKPSPIAALAPIPGATSKPTTPKPTRNPSAKPSLMLQVSPVINNVVMLFDDCQKLSNSSIGVWTNVTTRYVKQAMTLDLFNSGMQFSDLQVVITFRSQLGRWQTAKNSTNSTSSKASNTRFLQANQLSPLNIFFDVLIKLRSPDHTHDWQAYFIDTLNTQEKLDAYLVELSSSNDPAFNPINNVSVTIDGQNIAQVQESVGTPAGEKSNTGLILGIAAAAAVVAVTAIGFIACRKKGNSGSSTIDYNNEDGKVVTDDDGMYIEVEHTHDDISTLGDGFIGNWQSQQRFDDPTVGESTIKCDTVYQNYITGNAANTKSQRFARNPSKNPYAGVTDDDVVISKDGIESTPPFQGSSRSSQESVSAGTLPEPNVNPTVARDFETICEEDEVETRIEVNAPPGKLGVIIDAAKNGQLTVNSIKASSPLSDLVQIGDVLVSVDGESTQGLTAHRASALISSKADNPRRVLVFVRNAKSE